MDSPIETRRVAVIACDVLEAEVRQLAEGSPIIRRIDFVPQGLHNEPMRLRSTLQEAVTRVETDPDIDHIALVYGLCSRGTEALRLKRCRLVIPRAHDCVTLFLGDRHRYAEYVARHPGTYWYSPGWIKCHATPGPERLERLRREFTEKFGEDDAEYLIEMEKEWISHYNRATHVTLGIGDPEGERAYTRRCAECLGWDYDQVEGDPQLLSDLLHGRWDDERFLIVNPGEVIRLTADERVIKAVPDEDPTPAE